MRFGRRVESGTRSDAPRFDCYDSVTVVLPGGNAQYRSPVYESGDGMLTIRPLCDLANGHLVVPETGSILSLATSDGTSVFRAEAQVTAILAEPSTLIVLRLPAGWRRERDRRQHPRVGAGLPVRFAPVTMRGVAPDMFAAGRLIDIGAGGIRFTVPDGTNWRRGDTLYVAIDLVGAGRDRCLLLVGRVVRVENRAGGRIALAVRFDGASDRERAEVSDWVAEQLLCAGKIRAF